MANFIGIPFLNPLCLCLRIFSANNRPYRIQSVAIKFGNIMQPEKSEFMPGISDRFRQKRYNVCMNSAIKAGIQVFIKPIDFINIFFVAERQQALRSPLRIFLRKEIFYHDYFSSYTDSNFSAYRPSASSKKKRGRFNALYISTEVPFIFPAEKHC